MGRQRASGRTRPIRAGATLKSAFAPVVSPDTRVLVCGSLPGEASLGAGRYYAHPRNQFWTLIGGVIGCDLVRLDYDARLAALLAHRVGLWDSVARATRQGSLDAAIREVEPAPLGALAATLPALCAVAFNGGAAWRIGRRQFAADSALALVQLPSSSPAYCRVSLHEKQQAWNDLRKFLR
ncbi:DNA-deoxyinosine glycosylase [Novosphingobium huizhouense]|uniref:DNA-deoxyinosine glycosylase n=1 Tax=Novosphingobium huizhouense TaxID=2866625 RepID=UPI00296F6228|nr:DNA-deoxyinosine glycosylase [Novosphingobium huizhouense]